MKCEICDIREAIDEVLTKDGQKKPVCKVCLNTKEYQTFQPGSWWDRRSPKQQTILTILAGGVIVALDLCFIWFYVLK